MTGIIAEHSLHYINYIGVLAMTKAIHKAANGTKYVYESISYWDKQKKAPRTKQVYLGKLDPESNELIPKRVAPEKDLELRQPSVRTIGPTIAL